MADKTQINSALAGEKTGTATVVNPKVKPQNNDVPNATVINPKLAQERVIPTGRILCNNYKVIEKMAVTTGEADLYICSFRNEEYIAKVYRRTDALKNEVIQQVKTIDSPYIARIYATGKYKGFDVVILPYYRKGSLQGKTYTYDQLKDMIIPCLNEGLKLLHDAHVLHKDIKPSNIMLCDDEKSVAIIDFGISSVTEAENTMLVTQTGMTPAYSAPEALRGGIFSSNADYYSLGITLYELYTGKVPYSNMSPEEMDRYIIVQNIPFPKDMPKELQDLIKALTYTDISRRHDKNNPNRRWGYEEVKKWLSGVTQTIPGEGFDHKKVIPFTFCGKDYTDLSQLVDALAINWNEGKKQLFRGKLSEYFRLYNEDAFKTCQKAENEASHVSGKDDMIYWKTLCALDSKSKKFLWKGHSYAGLPALGRELLDSLNKGSTGMNEFMDSILRDSIMSQYISMKDPGNTKMQSAVQGLESSYRAHAHQPREQKVVLYLAGYMLSGQHILHVGGQEFQSLDELTSYMKELLGPNNEHLEEFKQFCHSLMDTYDHLIPAFEAWLAALGKREELDAWKDEFEND